MNGLNVENRPTHRRVTVRAVGTQFGLMDIGVASSASHFYIREVFEPVAVHTLGARMSGIEQETCLPVVEADILKRCSRVAEFAIRVHCLMRRFDSRYRDSPSQQN